MTVMDRKKAVSVPTLRRLPMYHGYLKKFAGQGRPFVSCTQISAALDLVPIQVRKDLQSAGIDGKPRVGYEVAGLIKSLEEFLGWNNISEAYLVGAGDLGAALLGYRGFNDHGLDIVAAFDNDPRKIGRRIHEKNVYPLDKFVPMVKKNGVLIGILAVPRGAAQEVANDMVKAGIRAIWNFTSVRILVPPDIIVQDENLASSLAVLSKRLAQSLHLKRP